MQVSTLQLQAKQKDAVQSCRQALTWATYYQIAYNSDSLESHNRDYALPSRSWIQHPSATSLLNVLQICSVFVGDHVFVNSGKRNQPLCQFQLCLLCPSWALYRDMLSSLRFGETQQYVLQSGILSPFSQKHNSFVGCNANAFNSAANESDSVLGFIPKIKKIRDWLLPMHWQYASITCTNNTVLVTRGLHTSLVLHQGQHRIQLQRVVTTSLCACLHVHWHMVQLVMCAAYQ